MIRRRLHLQIYATIILSLILVVLLTSMFFWLGNRDDTDFEFKEAAGQLAINILPDADQPVMQQTSALEELFKDINVKGTRGISFDENMPEELKKLLTK